MPSSKPSRSPARTFAAMGFNFWSLRISSLISNSPNRSTAPNGRGGSPEQKEQQTNIAVHGEKRSVELAEVVGFDKRVLVREQGADYGDSRPCRPWQRKARGKPGEECDDRNVHHPRDHQRPGDAEA